MAENKPVYVDPSSGQLREPRQGDTFINEPDVSFDTISDLTDYKIDQSPRTKTANVMGYYSAGDGGGGTFYWDANESKANHNGGTIINPDHLSTIGSSNWYSASGDSTDTSGSGCWVRFKTDRLSVLQWGAKDEVGYDSTNAFQTSADIIGEINVIKSTNAFEIDSITTTRQTIVQGFGGAEIKLRTPSVANDYGFDFQHAQSGIKDIHINANSTSRTSVSLSADDCFAYFTSENVIADSGSSSSTSALEINSANRCRFKVYDKNASNTGQSNESIPRVVTVQGTSDDYSGSLYGENINCGIVLGSNTGIGSIQTIDVESVVDNGIYQLGGRCDVSQLVYEGDEEGIVVGGDLSISNYSVRGNLGSVISLNNGDSLEISELVLKPNNTNGCSSIVRTRSGQGFGYISIDNISGELTGNSLFGLPSSNGNVDSFVLGGINVKYKYDVNVSGSISSWCDLTGVQKFNITNFKVDIIDLNNVLTSSDIFQMEFNSSITYESRIINPKINIFGSDEVTFSDARLRLVNTAQEHIERVGLVYRNNLGPAYARESSFGAKAGINRADVVPTSGYWQEGDILYDLTHGNGGVGWIAKSSGTSPDFRSFGEDFESGSMTLQIEDESGNAGTATFDYAEYRKVGDILYINIRCEVTDITGMNSAEEFRITGLPYNSASLSSGYFAPITTRIETENNPHYGGVRPNTDILRFQYFSSGLNNVTVSEANGKLFFVNGSYLIS